MNLFMDTFFRESSMVITDIDRLSSHGTQSQFTKPPTRLPTGVNPVAKGFNHLNNFHL